MPKKNRECDGKIRHKTKEGACIQAKKSLNVGMNVYRCKTCRFWHIGRTRTATRSADRITALLKQHDRKIKRSLNA